MMSTGPWGRPAGPPAWHWAPETDIAAGGHHRSPNSWYPEGLPEDIGIADGGGAAPEPSEHCQANPADTAAAPFTGQIGTAAPPGVPTAPDTQGGTPPREVHDWMPGTVTQEDPDDGPTRAGVVPEHTTADREPRAATAPRTGPPPPAGFDSPTY